MTQAVPLWWKIAHVWLAVDAQGVCKNVIRHVSDGRLKSHYWLMANVAPMARVGPPPMSFKKALGYRQCPHSLELRLDCTSAQGDLWAKYPFNIQNPLRNRQIRPVHKPENSNMFEVTEQLLLLDEIFVEKTQQSIDMADEYMYSTHFHPYMVYE